MMPLQPLFVRVRYRVRARGLDFDKVRVAQINLVGGRKSGFDDVETITRSLTLMHKTYNDKTVQIESIEYPPHITSDWSNQK